MTDLAFEITKDDIVTVLGNHKVFLKGEKLEEATSIVDDDAVSSAAMSVDFDMDASDDEIMDMQMDAAYDEIARQLYESGYLSDENIAKYGNPVLLLK